MNVLFVASLIVFLVAEVFSATKLFSTSRTIARTTMAVWCFVPLLIVSVLLWNHSNLWNGFQSTQVILTQIIK